MSVYVKNYGFTKTIIKDNKKKTKNEIKWIGDYDGKLANMNIAINNNGNKELVNMELDNNELMNLLGIQPVNISLEERLANDFYKSKPMVLEGALTNYKKRKSRKHLKKNSHKKQGKKTRSNKMY